MIVRLLLSCVFYHFIQLIALIHFYRYWAVMLSSFSSHFNFHENQILLHEYPSQVIRKKPNKIHFLQISISQGKVYVDIHPDTAFIVCKEISFVSILNISCLSGINLTRQGMKLAKFQFHLTKRTESNLYINIDIFTVRCTFQATHR